MPTLLRLVLVAVGSMVGVLVGSAIGALIFWIWIEDVPADGTGNARFGLAWALAGGLTGAVVLAGATLLLTMLIDRR